MLSKRASSAAPSSVVAAAAVSNVAAARVPGRSSGFRISGLTGKLPSGSLSIGRSGGGPVTRGGSELVYIDGDKMMVASITNKREFAATRPELLFEWRRPPRLFEGHYRRYYDVSADGENFLMVQGGERETSKQLHVVLHWGQELQN